MLFAVRKKIYDSIIILTDIMNIGVSQLKNNMEYILVYNEEINKNEKDVLEKQKIHVRLIIAVGAICELFGVVTLY